MDTKTLGCMDLAKLTVGWNRPFPMGEVLTFSERACTYQEAIAHLQLHDPDGRIVIVKKRGPKGGWGSPRFTSNPVFLRVRRRATFHIVVGG